MNILLDAIEVAVTIPFSFMAGRLFKKKAKQPAPICGCEHHYSYHEGTTQSSKCHFMIYGGGGKRYSASYNECTCQRYTGPINIDDFFQLPKYQG